MKNAMLSYLGHSQQTIMHTLLTANAPLTIEELGRNLGISKNAVYQHIGTLERTGLIEKSQLNRTGGRPSQSYALSEVGRNLFPKHYAMISSRLLDVIMEDLGPERVAFYLGQLGERLADDHLDKFEGRPLEDRVEILANIMSSLGYEAEVDQPSPCASVEITAHNCVFHTIAKSHKEVCAVDIAMISKLLGTKIDHAACMAKGDACCRFAVVHKSGKPMNPPQT